MIKAIFFDFDGVIVDSEKLHTDNTINYFKEANIPLSESIVYGDIGSNPKLNYWKGVYDEYKDMKSTEIAAEVRRRVEETIQEYGGWD